jgi:hypothetical protein
MISCRYRHECGGKTAEIRATGAALFIVEAVAHAPFTDGMFCGQLR